MYVCAKITGCGLGHNDIRFYSNPSGRNSWASFHIMKIETERSEKTET